MNARVGFCKLRQMIAGHSDLHVRHNAIAELLVESEAITILSWGEVRSNRPLDVTV